MTPRVALALGLLLLSSPGTAAPTAPHSARSKAVSKPRPAAHAATGTKPVAPSFAGRWDLDVAASDFGKSKRIPRKRTDEIREDSGWVAVHEVSVREDADTLRLDFRYRQEGDAVNVVVGQEVRTRGHREGGSLRFVSVTKFLMIEIRQTEQWKLSTEGKTLTVDRETHSPLGNDNQRLIFHRSE